VKRLALAKVRRGSHMAEAKKKRRLSNLERQAHMVNLR
jgi:hypothetical protein